MCIEIPNFPKSDGSLLKDFVLHYSGAEEGLVNQSELQNRRPDGCLYHGIFNNSTFVVLNSATCSFSHFDLAAREGSVLWASVMGFVDG